ncbi:hypothetical protein NITLEN_100021 [Nitrospira lenta]|uniref:Uncharacterized protein n=1 Tax=Nitrospira lenta TaxID=1436998 RepID=A0A330L4E0_9BACT|nr:hypothetical protein NITLEN_100021 [Nitrospira lenta]
MPLRKSRKPSASVRPPDCVPYEVRAKHRTIVSFQLMPALVLRGDEVTVREWLGKKLSDLSLVRRHYPFRYCFLPQKSLNSSVSTTDRSIWLPVDSLFDSAGLAPYTRIKIV